MKSMTFKSCFYLAGLIFVSTIISNTAFGKNEPNTNINLRPYILVTNEFNYPGLKMAIAERTFEAVAKAVWPHPLIIKSVKTIEELDDSLSLNSADFVIAGSAIFWRHLKRGYRDIATLVTSEQPDPDHAVGALVVARAEDNSVNSLDDLKGKTLGVNHPIGFQGLLVIKKELLDKGYDADSFFKKINFYGLDPSKRLQALRDRKVDAVSLNVCYRERELKKGNDVLAGLKVIDSRPNESNCLASTTLYPNWSFLTAPSLDSKLLVKVANALYSIPVKQDGQKWTLATDFRSADNLYRTLKTGPYSYLRSWTIDRIWSEYKLEILLALLFVLFVFFHTVRSHHLVKVRTAELHKALDEQKRLRLYSEKILKQQEELKRISTISQISAMVAHELSHPLSCIQLYGRALTVLIKKQLPPCRQELFLEATNKLLKSAVSAEAIVREVRDYAKSKNDGMVEVSLKKVVEKSLESFVSSGKAEPNCFVLETENTPLKILGRPLEIEIMLTNLIKNSLEAADNQPKIKIHLFTAKNKVNIEIIDKHKEISEEEFERIISPSTSLKCEGLGLGLSIVRGIVENHAGTISFQRLKKGLKVRLSFPTLHKE